MTSTDGLKEFATAGISIGNVTSVWHCVGNDTFAAAWADTVNLPNGSDVFAGDVDGDGIPEFFIRFAWFSPPTADFYLYMYKATGANLYRKIIVDHFTRNVGNGFGSISRCGDIDGDGKDEVVWSVGTDVNIYRYLGDDQFERIWQWSNPGTSGVHDVCTNVYDLNRNGYEEIVLSGDLAGRPGYPTFQTVIYEVEAVRVLSPNGWEVYSAGDTQYVKWRTFTPPRCDSLSVWFSNDNGQTYAPIVRGLPPSAESVPWQVPDIHSMACRVKVIAYGPGWQYDESDTVFTVLPSDIEERAEPPVLQSRLNAVAPNPVGSSARIRFQLKDRGKVRLSIRDASGRLVKALIDGSMNPGHHEAVWIPGAVPSGVYFLAFAAADHHEIRKVTVVR